MTGDTRQLLDGHMDERRRELHLTWDQVATLAKIHRETLRQIRRGSSELRPLTKAGIESALQWKAGSIEAILGGGEPSPLDQPVERHQPRHRVTGQSLQEMLDSDPELRAEMARIIADALGRRPEPPDPKQDESGESRAS